MAERAKELVTRDHIRSAKLESVFENLERFNMVGSRATERLFREALAKNPNREIQGLSCYCLARFLDKQALYVRLTRMFDPTQLGKMRIPINAESWGNDYEDRLLKLDTEAVERAAALLYEQVGKQYADIPLPGACRIPPATDHPPGNRRPWERRPSLTCASSKPSGSASRHRRSMESTSTAIASS